MNDIERRALANVLKRRLPHDDEDSDLAMVAAVINICMDRLEKILAAQTEKLLKALAELPPPKIVMPPSSRRRRRLVKDKDGEVIGFDEE